MATPKTILLVEDDSFLVKAYETTFSEKYTLLTAADGDEALRQLAKTTPDIVILDLIMPQKNGLEVLKEMKKNESWKHIPILVATNIGQDAEKKQALELGATEFVIKSDFSIRQMEDKVSELLGNA